MQQVSLQNALLSFCRRHMVEPRRFPIPWTIGETEACYYVQDASGAKLAYCYFLTRDRLAHDANKLDRAEALKIARNIVKLPEMLRRPEGGFRLGPSPSRPAPPTISDGDASKLDRGLPSPGPVLSRPVDSS